MDGIAPFIYGGAGFRPLSWGLSFNGTLWLLLKNRVTLVFVPFLGDFFSI